MNNGSGCRRCDTANAIRRYLLGRNALPPRFQLLLVHLSQEVDIWDTASHNPFGHFDTAANHVPLRNGVCDGLGPDLNDPDSWIVWSTVVDTITEVSQPCF
jgi:hypothetical protein